MLFNVLKAYAVHNREVGYCQAQGPIAALLLMHMPEEDAFWMLVKISDMYLKEYFKAGLAKVQVDGHTLFELFKSENKSAHELLAKQEIQPVFFVIEWFMCMYGRSLPVCTVFRIWDMFFCEGVKVLHRVGLYFTKTIFADKTTLDLCSQMGMIETLNRLKNLPLSCLYENNLTNGVLRIKFDVQEFRKLSKKSKKEPKITT
jgi:hypothetical protein